MIASSRDTVLARIATALAAGASMADVTGTVEARRATPPRWTRPRLDGDLVQRFIAKARANLCHVHPVASLRDLGPAVEALLPPTNAPRDVSIAASLRDVAWPQTWAINTGKGRLTETVAITDALAGVAETGSLVLTSAPERPTTLNFLPETHVIVLAETDILAHFEDVWPRLRALPVWPRTVNVISAASRTADVAQIVVRPAHGPKELHIMLVKNT